MSLPHSKTPQHLHQCPKRCPIISSCGAFLRENWQTVALYLGVALCCSFRCCFLLWGACSRHLVLTSAFAGSGADGIDPFCYDHILASHHRRPREVPIRVCGERCVGQKRQQRLYAERPARQRHFAVGVITGPVPIEFICEARSGCYVERCAFPDRGVAVFRCRVGRRFSN